MIVNGLLKITSHFKNRNEKWAAHYWLLSWESLFFCESSFRILLKFKLLLIGDTMDITAQKFLLNGRLKIHSGKENMPDVMDGPLHIESKSAVLLMDSQILYRDIFFFFYSIQFWWTNLKQIVIWKQTGFIFRWWHLLQTLSTRIGEHEKEKKSQGHHNNYWWWPKKF